MAGSAFADDECSSDADCDDGFECETVEEPCEAEPCEIGEDGEDCDTSCDGEESEQCVPIPPDECDTVDDCTGDQVCVTYTYESCSDVACAPDSDCPDTGSGCETHSEGYCLPPYLAPCEEDAHCGDGFSCDEVEYETCDGSGSTDEGSGYIDAGTGSADAGGETSDGGWDDDDAGSADGGGDTSDGGWDDEDAGSGSSDTGDDTECTTETTGEKMCQFDEQTCDDDSDCSGSLVCDTLPEGTGYDDTTYCVPDDLDRWVAIMNGEGDTQIPGPVSGSEDSANESADAGTEEGSSGGTEVEVDRGEDSDADDFSDDSAGCASSGPANAPGSAALALIVVLGAFFARRYGAHKSA